jgi:hypothetical protein
MRCFIECHRNKPSKPPILIMNQVNTMKVHALKSAAPGAQGSSVFIRRLSLLCLLLLSVVRANATLVTIQTSYGNSSTYSGLYSYYKYTSSESIYKASEIGTVGNISSMAFYKRSGTSNNLDSVYIYMKESTATTVSSTASLSGYTLVYTGNFPNTAAAGWKTVTLSSVFPYTGAGNLHIMVVRRNATTYTSYEYYDYSYNTTGTAYSSGYYYASSDPWSGTPPTSTQYTTTYARNDIQLNLDAFAACTGTPTAGTAIASKTTSCPGEQVKLSLSGSSMASSITYTWDTSSTGTGGWGVLGTSTTTPGDFFWVPPTDKTLYYRCRLLCSAGGASVTSTTVAVSVPAVLLPPYNEDFEGATGGVNVACAATTGIWSSTTTCYNPYFDLKTTSPCLSSYPSVTNHTAGGSKYIFAGYYIGAYNSSLGAAAETQYWYTPGIRLFAGRTYRFSYWYANSGYGSSAPKYGMYYNTSQGAAGATAIKADFIDASTTYKQNVGDFSVPADGIYYMAVKINQTTYYYYGLAFDDVNLIELPLCNTATASTFGTGGKASASPAVICSTPGTTTLSVSSTPPFSGLTFTWESASGTPTTFTATGLTAASGSYTISTGGVYYFRCKVTCAATGLTAYSDTIKVTTTPIPPPYTEDFESATPGTNQPCAAVVGTFTSGTTQYWDIKALNPYSSTYVGITNHTPGGSKYLFAGYYMGGYTSTATPSYWVTPALALTAGKAYKFSFWYSSNYNYSYYNYGPVQLGVRLGTAQTLAGMSSPVGADTIVLPAFPTSPTYDQLNRSFMVHTTGAYYLGIKNYPLNYNYPGIAMDDIALVELPSCAAKPSAGAATAAALTVCGGATDTLSLLGTAWASDLTFQWQSSATAAAGSWSDVSTGAGGNTSVYITPSLTVTGPVYYRCVVKCPAMSGANTDTSASIRVNVNAIVPPYSEDFETARAGINMPCAGYTGTWTPGTSSYWDMRVGPFMYLSNVGVKNHTPGGSKYLFAGYYLGSWSTSAQYWFTPALSLTAAKAYNFSFWYSNTGYSTSYAAYGLELGVRLGNAQTAAAMTIAAGADTTVYPNAGTTATYDLLQRGFIAPTTGNYYVGIRVNYLVSYNYYGFAIDDINLTQLPPCAAKPSAGKATATPAVICGSGTTTLGLDGVSVASDLNFQWWECDASGKLVTALSGATMPGYTTGTISTVKYYRCVVTCPLISAPNVDTSKLIRVSVTPIVPPYTEDFEGATAGINAPCASYSGTWGTTYWYLNDAPNGSYPGIRNRTAGGKKYLFAGVNLGNYNSGMVPRYWFTPGLSLTAGKSYKFTAWYTGSGSVSGAEPWGQMSFFAGTAQTEAAMTMMLGDTVYYGGDATYRSVARSFTVPSSGTYYIGIKIDNMGNVLPGMAIDDISLEENPACAAKPAAGRAFATPGMICSSGTSILRASGTSQASGLSYQWQTAAAAAGPWTNASGGTGASSADYTTATLSTAGPYYYRCIVTCAASGLTDTTTPARLDVGYITPPYNEDFERANVSVNQPCASSYAAASSSSFQNYANYYYYWAIIAGDSYISYPGCTNRTPGGLKHLVAGYALGSGYSSSYTTNYWFTPAIKLTKDSSYEFSYWYALGNYPYTTPVATVGMYYGTAQTTAGMTTAIIPDLAGETNTSFKQLIGRLVAPSTGNFYFGIKVNNTGYVYYGLSIDDINLEQLPPCSGKPTAGTVSVAPAMLCTTGGTATLSMDMGGVSRSSGLRYYWQYTDTDPASGFVPSGTYGSSASPLTSPATTTGALGATRWFRCIVKCINTGDSVISSTVKVDVGVITPPYIETFESGTPNMNQPCAAYTYSGGGSVYTAPTGSYWGYYYYWNLMGTPSPYFNTAPLDNHTPGGSKYLIGGYNIGYSSYSGYTQEYWFTPAIKFTAGKLYQLSYWYMTDGISGTTAPNYNLAAFMGTSQTAAAMTIPLGPALTNLNNTSYLQVRYQFTPTASGSYYIGFKKGQTAFGYGLALDDIGVQEVPPCSAPVVAGAITTPTDHICSVGGTTSLDLSGTTLATGLAYTWQSRSGSGSWSTFATGAAPVSTPSLAEATWFRCIVTCAATAATDTTPEYKVTVGGMDLPYSEDFEKVMDKPLCSDATYWGMYFYDGWKVYTGNYTGAYTNHTPGGKKYLIAGYYMGATTTYTPITEDNYWFSPGFNFRAGYKYELSFWFLAAGSSTVANRMGVYYGGSQSVGSMTNAILPFQLFSNTMYTQFDTTFVPKASGLYYLGFKVAPKVLNATSLYGVAFDDINLDYAPCDGLPFSGAIMGTVTSGTSLCKGTMVTLTDTGATILAVPGIKYQWQRRGLAGAAPTAWTAIAGATDTTLKGDTLIGYEYRLGVICGNTHDTAFTAAHQLPALPAHPAVAILPSTSPITFCLGDTVLLNATSFSGAVYDWMRDSVTVPGWKFSDMGATEPGNYMVKVTSPLSPCPAFSAPVKLQAIDPGYKVEVTVPADSFLCVGTSVTLTAVGSKAGLTYQWRKDNVDIPGATSTTYVVTASGQYRVMASDGSSGCPAASRNVAFTVKPNPPAVISVPGGTLTACEEVGVLLQANTGGYSYQWNRAGSPVFGWVDSAVVVTTPGTYTVKVRSADGCLSESVPVTINILPSPTPVIVVSGPSSSPTLGTAVSTYLSYMWIRTGATTDTAYTTTLMATKKGSYRVIVTDANGCTGVSMPVELTDASLGIGNVAIKGSDIRIFPNPTDSKVFIESPVSIRLQVKDATGKTILDKTDVTEVDMSRYADGVYMFIVSDRSGKQLIKEQRVNKISK